MKLSPKIDNRLGSNENLISAQGYFRRAVGEDVRNLRPKRLQSQPGVINKLYKTPPTNI